MPNKNQSDSKNCEHIDLKYIGEQTLPDGKPIYSLFKCLCCDSTISVEYPKSEHKFSEHPVLEKLMSKFQP